MSKTNVPKLVQGINKFNCKRNFKLHINNTMQYFQLHVSYVNLLIWAVNVIIKKTFNTDTQVKNTLFLTLIPSNA